MAHGNDDSVTMFIKLGLMAANSLVIKQKRTRLKLNCKFCERKNAGLQLKMLVLMLEKAITCKSVSWCRQLENVGSTFCGFLLEMVSKDLTNIINQNASICNQH